jgi:hypothetical protein
VLIIAGEKVESAVHLMRDHGIGILENNHFLVEKVNGLAPTYFPISRLASSLHQLVHSGYAIETPLEERVEINFTNTRSSRISEETMMASADKEPKILVDDLREISDLLPKTYIPIIALYPDLFAKAEYQVQLQNFSVFLYEFLQTEFDTRIILCTTYIDALTLMFYFSRLGTANKLGGHVIR